jgi:hypothetical protein
MPAASKIVMSQGEAPLTPPVNTSIIYVKSSDGKFYTKDSNDLETLLGNPTTILATSITDGDTTHAPDVNSVYDALALKSDSNHTHAMPDTYSQIFYNVRRR